LIEATVARLSPLITALLQPYRHVLPI